MRQCRSSCYYTALARMRCPNAHALTHGARHRGLAQGWHLRPPHYHIIHINGFVFHTAYTTQDSGRSKSADVHTRAIWVRRDRPSFTRWRSEDYIFYLRCSLVSSTKTHTAARMGLTGEHVGYVYQYQLARIAHHPREQSASGRDASGKVRHI